MLFVGSDLIALLENDDCWFPKVTVPEKEVWWMKIKQGEPKLWDQRTTVSRIQALIVVFSK